MAENKGASHSRPDFTIKHDAGKAKAAAKKVESLKAQIAELKEEIKGLEKEMSVASAEAKGSTEPGFSNAPSEKEQTEANKATQAENAKTSTATKK